MTEQRHIDEQRKNLISKSDSDLIKVVNERQPYSADRIAAEQILHERSKQQSKVITKIEKNTNTLTKWILGLTILMVVLMVYQLYGK